MPSLFDSFTTRGLTLPHRIIVSPMCEYSSIDGFANDWHLVHLGSRAVGGAALVITEATAVTAEGRISPNDLGIYKDAHVETLQRIIRFIRTAVGGTWRGRRGGRRMDSRGTGRRPVLRHVPFAAGA
jgi:2,4-dienoyl-CoA reductase-like NADH-dependent reductase (Old Yellow Enzyme family)